MAARAHVDVDAAKQRRLAQHYLVQTHEDAARLGRTAALAADSLNFPVAQINILDDQVQHTIGEYGSSASTVPRELTMCQFVLDDDLAVLAVEDMRTHERYRDLPAVRAGSAVSYLGVPVWSREATAVGTLCLVDDQPRTVSAADIDRLQGFAEIVTDQLDVVRRNAEFPASREVRTLLADALAAGEFVPWYQPVFDLVEGRRRGFEALARWQRPDGTVISPEAFVGAAEDSDLVVDLDRAIVSAALRDCARWRRTDRMTRVGINLSTRHLELAEGAAFVIEATEHAGLDPLSVIVEITETRLLGDIARASTAVRELRNAGFWVVLDDFASGWSNLDWLLGLGVDGIKIDRSVTTAMGTKVGDAVCRAVAGLAEDLDMLTTIEGIDNATHLAAAQAIGFHLGQGFHWSPPVPAAAVDAML